MPTPWSLLAEATVSTGFMVLAWIAIAAVALVILAGLFGPGLRYRVSVAGSEDNKSEGFLQLLEALTDAKIHRATTLEVLTNGPSFYEEELRAIATARKSVNLEAYIFQRGEIADRYLEALTERARAGVKVNIVLDALGSASTTNKYFAALKQAGGKLAWYNNATWHKLPRYNHRTHRELMVVDGCIGFIGGAGIADHWYKDREKKPRWRDTMVRVE